MNDDVLNISVRKFLKMVGVGSQREIEHAIQKAVEQGRLGGSETLQAKMKLTVPQLGLDVDFDGEIKLE